MDRLFTNVAAPLKSALILLAFSVILSSCTHSNGEKTAEPEPQGNADAQVPSSAEIGKAQRMLNALGYDAGPADGVLGPKTGAAIRSFQKDQHIAGDGKLAPNMVNRLTAVYAKLPVTASPKYEVGETIVYSDGSAEKVLGITDDEIRVQTGGGERRKPANFLLFAEADATSDAPADFLQPLRAGRKGDYKIYRRTGDQDHVSVVSCVVGDQRSRTVPAGKFSVVDVACNETGDAGPKVEREWSYAPAIRQVIREVVRIEGAKAAIRELVAVQPDTEAWPTAARTGFDWAIVNALEGDAQSTPVMWSSTGAAERFSIRVDYTAVPPSALPPAGLSAKRCLRYKLLRTDPTDEGRIFPGLACRLGTGDWIIPARAPRVFANPPKGLQDSHAQ